ncbi:MAG: prepilin-type N-terminal cleavage/methylation domain-containing protein, partial [Phycisphaerales bacterium]|nr:prepilin-type N-terminal cleavage/methylation domain-containing protein [Phycisphaerales bacterium]
MTKAHRGRRAFTLIEVMIVVVIILALSGLGALALFGKKAEAEEKLAQVDLNTIADGLDFFYLAHQ